MGWYIIALDLHPVSTGGVERKKGKDVGRVDGKQRKEGQINSSSLNPVSLISPFVWMHTKPSAITNQPC